MSTQDEDALKAMGRMLQTDDIHEEMLRRLSEGRLSVEDHDALISASADDPALADAVVLHEPLSATVQEKLRITATMGLKAKAEVTPLRRPQAWLAVASVALAASLAGVVVSRASLGPQPLPRYELLIRGGDAQMRSDAPPTPATGEARVLREDSPLTVALRPVSDSLGAVEAALFARAPTEDWQLVDVRPEKMGAAFRFQGSARSLAGGRTGQVDLRVVMHRPNSVPDPKQTATAFDLSVVVRPR